MDLQITLEGRGDLAARIYRQLQDAILDGRLRPGERLPPSRELARALEVSRNTVATAYDRLTAEGFLVGRVGAGTFVGTAPLTRVGRAAPAGSDLAPRRVWEPLAAPRTARPEPARYDFGVGVPDPGLFPLETWRRLVSAELRPAAIRSGGYGDTSGHAGLRAAIARYIGVSRAVRTGPDDVLVTTGAQQAFDLIGRVLVEPGSCVAVEEPGYPPVRELFASLGARVVGVPVDADGLDVAAIPRSARLVYVTPSHQFPLGTPMSLARRSALLDWAERRGAVIVEDDYDSEYRFSDRPLEPLQSLDRGGRVIYVGSFSKTLLPILRVGFLVAPASLQPALLAARRLSDWHGDQVTQGALARLIDEGLLARHIRRTAREYGARRELVLEIVGRDLAGVLEPVPSAAGLHLATRSVTTVDVADVVRRAAAAGVRVESLAAYGTGPDPQPGLVLGYGAIPAALIEPGLARLTRAFAASPTP